MKSSIFPKLSKSSSTTSLRKTTTSVLSTRSSFYLNQNSHISDSFESYYYYPMNERDIVSPQEEKIDLNQTMKKLNEWDRENITSYQHKPKRKTIFQEFKNKSNSTKASRKSLSFSKPVQLKTKELEKIFKINHKISNHLSCTIHKLTALQKEREEIIKENESRERLIATYKELILLKIKKRKYQQLLNDSCSMLDHAKTEYILSVDVLKDRIKAVQKYYEAFKDKPVSDESFEEEKKNFVQPKKQSERKGGNKRGSTMMVNNERAKIIFEEKTRKYAEYNAIVEDINNEINQYDIKYSKIKKDLSSLIEEIRSKLESVTAQKTKLKKEFSILLIDEKNYYLNLLKNGDQPRKEGLVWIVKRLIELGIQPELSFFPKFIDNEQIQYITSIAELQVERQQLEALLKQFSYRQHIIELNRSRQDISEEIKQKMNEIMEFDYAFYNKKVKHFFFDKFKEFLNSPFISRSNLNEIEKVFKDYIFLMREVCNNILNNNYVLKAVKELKKAISLGNYEYNLKMESRYRTIKKQEYDEDINILKKRIKEITLTLESMIKTEASRFKEKYYYFTKKFKNKSYYQNVFLCLFGSANQIYNL